MAMDIYAYPRFAGKQMMGMDIFYKGYHDHCYLTL
jgi:hypothetical protein